MISDRVAKIGFGLLLFIVSFIAVYYSLVGNKVMAIGFISITLACLSLFLTYEYREKMNQLIELEIQRKLNMFKEELLTNKDIIAKLIMRREKFYPPDLLKKKLNQNKRDKYNLTPQERKILSKGGYWIHKEDCYFYYALQVIEIGQHFDESYIKSIKEYIDACRKLNQEKDSIQNWIISRGTLNPDEVHNFYKALDNAEESLIEIERLTNIEYQRHSIKS